MEGGSEIGKAYAWVDNINLIYFIYITYYNYVNKVYKTFN